MKKSPIHKKIFMMQNLIMKQLFTLISSLKFSQNPSHKTMYQFSPNKKSHQTLEPQI